MFKIIGSIWVILAFFVVGMKKYTQLSDRRRVLFSVYDGAESILNNLRCMCMPLYDCFLCGGDFFSKAAEYMAEGESPKNAVKKTADGIACLKTEDRECFLRFSDGLSREDCEGQIRNAEMFLSGLQKNIENAQRELETRGKLFIRGSFLIGIAVVLVLI